MTIKSWIQDPKSGKLVPKAEYRPPKQQQFGIMPDITPFKSPIDGQILSTRSTLEEHNRRHNVTNSADYSKQWYLQKRRENVARAMVENRSDRVQVIQQAIHNQEHD